VLRDESDPVQDERLADHVICSHIRSHPEATADDKKLQPKLQMRAEAIQPIDQELLKYYIVYARKHVHPTSSGVDMEKVANFYKDIRAEAFSSGGAPMTARHVDSLMRIAEANARMELRQHVTNRDVDNAIGVMLESFIQSQKHQVAEELRKKFRRYAVQVTPPHEQFVNLLEHLLKEAFDQLKALRQGESPELAEVSVSMETFQRALESQELAVTEAGAFFESPRFQGHFAMRGEQIFRLL